MATTIRDQIMVALLARLQTIYPSAERKYLRTIESNLPAAIIWDSSEYATNVVYGKQRLKFMANVAIGHRLSANENASVIGNDLLGNLIKVIIASDQTLGSLAIAVRYQNSNINYPEPGGDWIVGLETTFEVEYETNLGDPYQQ